MCRTSQFAVVLGGVREASPAFGIEEVETVAAESQSSLRAGCRRDRSRCQDAEGLVGVPFGQDVQEALPTKRLDHVDAGRQVGVGEGGQGNVFGTNAHDDISLTARGRR